MKSKKSSREEWGEGGAKKEREKSKENEDKERPYIMAKSHVISFTYRYSKIVTFGEYWYLLLLIQQSTEMWIDISVECPSLTWVAKFPVSENLDALCGGLDIWMVAPTNGK